MSPTPMKKVPVVPSVISQNAASETLAAALAWLTAGGGWVAPLTPTARAALTPESSVARASSTSAPLAVSSVSCQNLPPGLGPTDTAMCRGVKFHFT